MQSTEYQTYPFGTIPKRLNDFFTLENRKIVGRTDELAQVRRDLLEGHATVLVNGIGGIGKTTIARKYVERHWDDYQHFAWLTVNAPQSVGHDPHRAAADEGYSPLREAFLRSPALWRSLGIEAQVEHHIDGKDLRGAFDLIRQRLGQLQNCLLVIDNANDAADLLENRPALKSLNAHVLVTSRAKPKEWNIVEVNELPLSLAVELFKQHYAHPSLAQASEADLNALTETLLRHTLLLELVGKSASPDGNNLPFPQLVESLQDRSFHSRYLNELPVDGGDHADGQNLRRQASVESYIALMFSHIRWEEPDRIELLKSMTLLPPGNRYSAKTLSEYCNLLGIEFQEKRADTLVQLGWLDRQPMPEVGVGYIMHPLILDVTFRELDVTAEWAAPVIDFIARMINYNGNNPEHDLLEKRKVKHFGEHLSTLFFEKETEQVSWLLDRMMTLEDADGNYHNAAKFGEQALLIAEKYLSEEIISVRQGNLSITCSNLGLHERARDLAEAAFLHDLKHFGSHDSIVALRASNLATIYSDLGQNEQAIELLETALKVDLDNLGPNHPSVAVHKSSLAVLYQNFGQYKIAFEFLKDAYQSDLQNFGTEHPSVAIRQTQMAGLLLELGQFKKAQKLYESALKSDLKNFGPNHPNIALIHNNLAMGYSYVGKYSLAMKHYIEALHITERTLGRDHPRYKISLQGLEKASIAQGQSVWAKVKKLFRL